MTEDQTATATPAEPVIDQEAVAKAQLDAMMAEQQTKSAAEHDKFMAELNHRRKEESQIAAAQDLALRNIRERCEAELAAFARSRVEATDA